jgi:glycosyltransferase involved in cell wall biosynthesis
MRAPRDDRSGRAPRRQNYVGPLFFGHRLIPVSVCINEGYKSYCPVQTSIRRCHILKATVNSDQVDNPRRPAMACRYRNRPIPRALVARKPREVELVNLEVRGKIGHPLSPLAIAIAMTRACRPRAIFWSPGFVPPLFGCARSIVTLHDLTHLKYYDRFRMLYYNYVLRPLFKRCIAIICVSEYTKNEFASWSKIDPSKVHVVYNSIDRRFKGNEIAEDLGFKYVFYAGNHRPYKNLERLVRAFARSSLPGRGIRLVLTGNQNPELSAIANALGVGNYICFSGWVANSRLPGLYRGALALVYVSLNEGFGIPLLEAMASDVPIVTSNTSAMAEIASDAAILIDPFSLEEITAALDRITSDEMLRSHLVDRGRERLKQFDWDKSAAEFWSIVAKCAREIENPSGRFSENLRRSG